MPHRPATVLPPGEYCGEIYSVRVCHRAFICAAGTDLNFDSTFELLVRLGDGRTVSVLGGVLEVAEIERELHRLDVLAIGPPPAELHLPAAVRVTVDARGRMRLERPARR